MQTWDAITSRRNVRSFADRPIAAADLDQILEAGRRAPSSQNWQPWDFIVVTERGQLRELARVWRGAGSCHAGVADLELARELLGFPEDRGWALLISLGYPADRPLTPVRRPDRRPFDEVVHRSRW